MPTTWFDAAPQPDPSYQMDEKGNFLPPPSDAVAADNRPPANRKILFIAVVALFASLLSAGVTGYDRIVPPAGRALSKQDQEALDRLEQTYGIAPKPQGTCCDPPSIRR